MKETTQVFPEIRWKNKDAPGMKVRKKGDVVYLTIPAFEDFEWMKHGFSTRLGGVSEGVYSSMNLYPTNGSNPEHVKENLKIIGNAIGFDPAAIIWIDQIHSTKILIVSEEGGYCPPQSGEDPLTTPGGRLKEAFPKETDIPEVDGTLTNVSGKTLMISTADCVPVLLADPVRHVVGMCHAGWRGTAGKICREAVRIMRETYGSRAEDIMGGIGPSVCRDCYEISEDVATHFREAFPEKVVSLFLDSGKKPGKYQLDLWEANRQVLLEAGLLPEHIKTGGLCTCCNPDLFFSHRIMGNRRGSNASFVMIA